MFDVIVVGAGTVIFTGPIDEFFDCKYGRLPYRTLHFDFEHYEQDDYQGNYNLLHVMYLTNVFSWYGRKLKDNQYGLMPQKDRVVALTE